MSLINIDKANINMGKFVDNTVRIIDATLASLKRIMEDYSHISEQYSDVPSLLILGKDLLRSTDEESRGKLIKFFLKKSSPVWNEIKNKDMTIIRENMSLILMDSPFIPRIQYIYGNNNDRVCYVNEKEIKIMWNLITALVHNSVKYALFSGDENLIKYLPENVVEEFNIDLSK